MQSCKFQSEAGRQRWPAALLATLALAATVQAQSPFATRVISYTPSPGQFVSNPQFNDPTRALGLPIGGGPSAADNTKCVTLGGFGGSIVLGFDHSILNQPPGNANPHGLDLIVYGNSFYVGASRTRRWAEAGVIEVSRDVNNNGLADDAWYVIPGSHLPAIPSASLVGGHYQLPAAIFGGPVVTNPLGTGATDEGIFGYADCTPTMVLGDLDGDGVADDLTLTPEMFYTRPDDPFVVGVTPGSGGGDAIDISWAVEPATGLPANLPSIDFVRITTAVDRVNGIFGEVSVEVCAVAEVRFAQQPPTALADVASDSSDTTRTPSGSIGPEDLEAFVNGFIAENAAIADVASDSADTTFTPNGSVGPEDLEAFINSYLNGGG